MGNQVKKNKFAQIEEEILDFWNTNKCFEKSVEMRSQDKEYVFYDGPPFATGLPHYGHIVPTLMKDMVPRFWTMKGYRVERVWGWDCHGLPIENIIEKDLEFQGRKDIEEYGIEKFNKACCDTVLKYADEWQKFIPRIGRWIDMDNAYKTMDIEYMESVWWVFQQLWEKELIYQGHKAMHVCPRCVTPLSNFEVTLGYKDVTDNSVIWKFEVTGQDNTYLLAWTTTPWSTFSTMGLAVGADHNYVQVQVGDEQLILAKERLDFVMSGVEDYQIIEEFKGDKLVGYEYKPIADYYYDLPEVKDNEGVYHVFATDYVEITEGTGIVTINGSYGEIDMEAAQANDLPIVMDVNMEGCFTEVVKDYAGMYVKDAEKVFLKDKQEQGFIWRIEDYIHSYPHCWRCDMPLLNYATTSWFVKVTELKDQLIKNNQDIHWVPSHIKDGRFGKWLEGARDWAISRNRFWGTPLPVWISEDGDVLCVGSVAELEELSGKKVDDLHKHIVDNIVITKNGKEYKRIPDVLDCWFESGSMPYGQWHYPFENKEKFEKNFPAAFIAEAQDQTRGWFYTLHVLATALTTGERPSIPVKESTSSFKNVVVNGIVLAEDGKKMSKKLKNYPDPNEVVDKYGADAIRYYLASNLVMEAESLNFSEKEVDEVQRKYINTLWNVFTFYQMYADKSDEEITEVTDSSEVTNVLDVWILSQLHTLMHEVTKSFEEYRLRNAARPLLDFIQELSTWYVRRSRSRFKGDDSADRLMALRVLYTVLINLAKVAAPTTPFITEKLWQEMRKDDDPISVHHCDWPEANKTFVDTDNAQTMKDVRDAIEKALSLRAEAGIKVRQPLQSVTIVGKELSEEYQEVLRDEVNVKDIKFGKEFVLDTDVSEELAQEGLLRELVRQTNSLRKKQKLSIQDNIEIKIQTNSQLVQQVLEKYREEYQKSVLANNVELVTDAQEHEIKVNQENLTLSYLVK